MSGGFWDRRREAVAAEAEAELAAVEAAEIAESHAELEAKDDAEILAELDLPDPDTLSLGDDFTAFMGKAVPDRIRRRALRVLWRSNPVLANVDMLVDYGEDFTDAATVIENMQTTYQVGKGMLKHVQEMARQAEERAKREAGELEENAEDAIEEDDIIEEEGLVAEADDALQVEPSLDDDEPYEAPAPRRMKFTIENAA